MPDSFLMTETAELTCGVCKDLFRNPYLLPCDHSFCRRPCLLPTPSSICATCIFCHIGVHVSELERNYELDERVQSYLAKRRNLESQRVPCYLCRSLYDHCTMCSHCNRQLCDLCFKEHVGEFHTIIRIKCQSLQNEVSQLKQTRANLVSRRTTVKPQRGMLFKSINSVSSDLLSACKTAFSRAEERLDRVQAQSHEKLTTMLNNQRLVELAVNLLRVLNDPAEHEDTQRLCEMRKVAQSAIETLTAIETPELRNDRYQFENFTLTGSLQTIGVQLRNLHLLVDQKSTAVASGTNLCLQGNSQRPSSSAPDTVDSLKTSERIQHDLDRQPLFSKHQHESIKQKVFGPNESHQQQQKDLQDRRAAGRSQKALEIYVDGVKANISAKDLKTHFAHFGQVLDVYMLKGRSKKKHRGNGYITLQPTRDLSQILETDHIIRGDRINVEECYSSDDEGRNSVRPTEDSKKRDANLQPALSEHQVEITKQKASSPTEPVQQQQLPTQREPLQLLGDLQYRQAVGGSQKALTIYVTGVKATITSQDLQTYFARFGEVQELYMCIDPSTNKHSGGVFITLRPIGKRSQILDMEHIILGVRINVWECCSSGSQKKKSLRLAEDGTKKDVNLQPALSEHEVEITKQNASSSTEPVQHQQQQRKNLHNCGTVGASQKALEIYVNGVKANITAEDLKTHFARFGQVLDVCMLMNRSTDKHNGNGCITLQPTRDPSQIIETDHIIRGVRINVKERYSSDDGGNNSVRHAEDSKKKDAKMELSLLGHKVEITKQEVSSPTEHVQQHQQRPAQQKLQQQRNDLQNCRAVGKPQKALEIYVDGVKANITADDLKTHFARFGEVLDVYMCMNPLTNKHNGSGYITLQPTGEPREILQTEHTIRGVRINVEECY